LKSFARFLSLLATIRDPWRAEGKLYQLPHVLLFSIFAIVSGANSYRGIRTFIKVHRQKLNKAFKINWKKPPAHTAIRYILRDLAARVDDRRYVADIVDVREVARVEINRDALRQLHSRLHADQRIARRLQRVHIVGSFTQRYVKRHGSRPPFRPDFEVPGYDPAENIGGRPSSRL